MHDLNASTGDRCPLMRTDANTDSRFSPGGTMPHHCHARTSARQPERFCGVRYDRDAREATDAADADAAHGHARRGGGGTDATRMDREHARRGGGPTRRGADGREHARRGGGVQMTRRGALRTRCGARETTRRDTCGADERATCTRSYASSRRRDAACTRAARW
ncbi:hypothetical protein EVAR_91983_1 [Eumeta japonica]|uniref:Uncharacterized protein n=1 Tax=Eumeta variegata TaxID=151549 RepID=A0A4C2ACA2_EUMVA|nr:hypothetical protein EVAR_91983_1 [Eumeta japonica]